MKTLPTLENLQRNMLLLWTQSAVSPDLGRQKPCSRPPSTRRAEAEVFRTPRILCSVVDSERTSVPVQSQIAYQQLLTDCGHAFLPADVSS